MEHWHFKGKVEVTKERLIIEVSNNKLFSDCCGEDKRKETKMVL